MNHYVIGDVHNSLTKLDKLLKMISPTMQEYYNCGVDGYVSLVGHYDTQYQCRNPKGSYLDEQSSSIWRNGPGNVYMMDCGCGLPGGRLACMCLEMGERFYV